MDAGTYLEFLEAKLNKRDKTAPARPNRGGFFSKYATQTVLLVLLSTTGAAAYFNPDARQWTIEAVSKAYSKFASITKTDYSQKTGQALLARANTLRVKDSSQKRKTPTR